MRRVHPDGRFGKNDGNDISSCYLQIQNILGIGNLCAKTDSSNVVELSLF